MYYEKGTFTTVPNITKLEGKSPFLQTIYLWICKFSNENGVCYPSQKRLSEVTGMSIDSCRRYLKELEDLGILARERRYSNNQEISSNYYIVVGGSSQQGGGGSSQHDGTKPTFLTKPTIISKDIKASPPTYGNQDITKLLEAIRQTIKIDDFKENKLMQRNFGNTLNNLLGKIGREEFRKRLDKILSDDFKRKNCNSLKYLYGEIKSCLPDEIINRPIAKF